MDDHDRILQLVLVGERTPDDPEVRAHLDGCAACRKRLARMRGLAGSLDELARQEREDLRAAPGERSSPGFEARVAEVRAGARSRPGLAPPVRWLLRAAAVLLTVFLVYRLTDEGPAGDRDALLGDGREIELVTPLELPRLRWSFDRPPGGYYEIRIVDETPEGSGTIVVRRSRVDEEAWSPSDSILPVSLPAAFRVTIDAFDASDVLLASHTVSLPLSSP